MPEKLKFTADDVFKSDSGIGYYFTEYIVENPSECNDFLHLINKVVEIDRNNYTIIGVNRFSHCPPWHKGEKIGLLVREVKTMEAIYKKRKVPIEFKTNSMVKKEKRRKLISHIKTWVIFVLLLVLTYLTWALIVIQEQALCR